MLHHFSCENRKIVASVECNYKSSIKNEKLINSVVPTGAFGEDITINNQFYYFSTIHWKAIQENNRLCGCYITNRPQQCLDLFAVSGYISISVHLKEVICYNHEDDQLLVHKLEKDLQI